VSGVGELVYRERPADADPEGLLVFLHGRGADELDLYPLLDWVDPERRLLGVTPRAPLTLPPGGAHWYVVREVGYPDPETFHASLIKLGAWLDALSSDAGIPSDRIVLGGFSQGSVMTYALGLGRGRPRPAGIIAMSGFVPTVDGFELDLDPPLPPAAIGHGLFDPVISVEFGRAARALLESAGADVLYRESPVGHTIDPGFLAELRSWIALRTTEAHARG
jgi:phospholipase/carboxylesterase